MFAKVARIVFGLFFAICAVTAAQATTLNIGDILVAGGTNLKTAIIRVDPTTGSRTLVSGVFSGSVGTGPAFVNLAGIALESNGDILVVDNAADALVRVDPVTGDRGVVSGCADSTCSSLVGTGPESFVSPKDVRVEADGSILVMDERAFDESTLFRVDPVTGDRTIVSSKSIGSDAPNGINSGFGIAGLIEVEQGNHILVYSRQYFILYRVDPVNGDRTVVSRSSELSAPPDKVGDGADFGGTNALALEDNGNILAFAAAVGSSSATDPVIGLIQVDPASGDRTLISGCNSQFPFGTSDCVSVVGAGSLFQDVRGMAREPSGNIIVSDRTLGFIRVDSISGDRTIMSPNSVPFGGAVAIVPDPAPPPDANLVSYWSFDDGTADDQVGTNDGVIVGGTTFTGGGNDAAPIPNNVDALRFNGIDSEVNVPDDVTLDFATTDEQTLAMWFKRESTRSTYHLLGKRVFCSSMNYQLARDGGLLHLNSSFGGRVDAGVDASLDTWVHIASTYDGATQAARIFINGVLQNTVAPYSLGPIVAGDLKIGNTGGCPDSQRFIGVIEEVRIYDRALTAQEIAALALNSGPDILVAPLAHDFGQVDAFTSKDTIVTISNIGAAGLGVTDVAITSGESSFAIAEFDPPALPPLVVPPGGDVFVTVTMFPTSEGAFAGTLTVDSDDPDEPTVDVSLIGNGLAGSVDDQSTALEAAVNDAIALGGLVGSGSGNSATGRLGAFADMIEAAGDLIEAGFITDACGQLRSALRRIDGDPRPPDFAEGDDAALIADQIEFLRDSLGCS